MNKQAMPGSLKGGYPLPAFEDGAARRRLIEELSESITGRRKIYQLQNQAIET